MHFSTALGRIRSLPHEVVDSLGRVAMYKGRVSELRQLSLAGS